MRRIVCFDVDSTLLAAESLDLALSQAIGDDETKKRAIAEITDLGMSGEIGVTESLRRRLAMAALDRAGVAETAEALRRRITPGMPELLGALRARGDGVFAVTGGFRDVVGPALADLGFTEQTIRANAFLWDESRVAGFDETSPLARNGGKAVVVRALKDETGAAHAVMVGDGVTDLEAYEAGAADAFVGFGGVARREAVEARAPAYAQDVDELKALLFNA